MEKDKGKRTDQPDVYKNEFGLRVLLLGIVSALGTKFGAVGADVAWVQAVKKAFSSVIGGVLTTAGIHSIAELVENSSRIFDLLRAIGVPATIIPLIQEFVTETLEGIASRSGETKEGTVTEKDVDRIVKEKAEKAAKKRSGSGSFQSAFDALAPGEQKLLMERSDLLEPEDRLAFDAFRPEITTTATLRMLLAVSEVDAKKMLEVLRFRAIKPPAKPGIGIVKRVQDVAKKFDDAVATFGKEHGERIGEDMRDHRCEREWEALYRVRPSFVTPTRFSGSNLEEKGCAFAVWAETRNMSLLEAAERLDVLASEWAEFRAAGFNFGSLNEFTSMEEFEDRAYDEGLTLIQLARHILRERPASNDGRSWWKRIVDRIKANSEP